MPTPNPLARREHAGAATPTTLTASMSVSDLAFSIASNTGWPTGGIGSFFVVIDPGTGAEEKVLCSAQSSSVVTVAPAGRGVDGTIAKSHAIGASVYPVWTAQEADELNEHAASVADVHGVAGSLPVALDGKQPLHAKLTALAASSTGFLGLVTQTGADGPYLKRTITSTDATVTVTNPAGTAGNIDLAVNEANLSGIPQAGVTGLSTALPPVGSITMWPTATPPTNWLICDGSTFSAATYPALNTLLGGNTLPDLRDRVPVGTSATKTVRATGGAASVTLAEANLPPHQHAVSITSQGRSAAHTHAIATLQKTLNAGTTSSDNGGDSVVQGQTTGRFVGGQTGTMGTESADHAHLVSGNTGNGAGTSTAVSVQNPYVALNFIIRAA